jgi:hypothetical protein
MTVDGREWTLGRHAPDFSPCEVHQRWLGTFDRHAIEGRWETSTDGRRWELDLQVAYHRPPAGSANGG